MTLSLSDRLCNMANEPTTSFSAAALMHEAHGEIERLTRELAEAKAACAAWSKVVETIRDAVLHERGAMAELDFGSDRINAVLVEIDDATPDTNPGQAMLDESAKLRAAINTMATDAMWIAQIDEGPDKGKWQWILVGETEWHGAYLTPLEAALAGVKKEPKDG